MQRDAVGFELKIKIFMCFLNQQYFYLKPVIIYKDLKQIEDLALTLSLSLSLTHRFLLLPNVFL